MGVRRLSYTLAIDIGGTKLAVGLFRDRELIERRTSKTDSHGGPGWMLDEIEKLAAELVKRYSIKICGVGFGGPVDARSQRVICSTHVEGWDDYDLVGALRERVELEAVIDRDTMVGALGEGYYGAGIGVRPLLYVTISTGIGGGLLTEHGLYHGADSFACEVGHQTVDPNGPECLCGSRGCLERLCAGLWLERDNGKPASELLQDISFIAAYVQPLARGIKTCVMMYNSARIVIGGGISKAGERLFVPLREELRREVPSWSRARIDLVPALLGDDTILSGALALANAVLRDLPA